MLTVYGIETGKRTAQIFINILVATVLTVYGIETRLTSFRILATFVATVLTVYGIETE